MTKPSSHLSIKLDKIQNPLYLKSKRQSNTLNQTLQEKEEITYLKKKDTAKLHLFKEKQLSDKSSLILRL